MGILAALYYFLGLIWIIPNLYYLFQRDPWYFKRQFPEEYGGGGEQDPIISLIGCLGFSLYVLWVITGLLTAKWVFFLGFLIVSFTLYIINSLVVPPIFGKTVSRISFKISTLIEIVFLLFITLNHFHFHITLTLNDVINLL